MSNRVSIRKTRHNMQACSAKLPQFTLYSFVGSQWAGVAHLALAEKGFDGEEYDLKEIDLGMFLFFIQISNSLAPFCFGRRKLNTFIARLQRLGDANQS